MKILKVEFTLATSGLSTGASSADGVLKVSATTDTKSLSAFINTSRVYTSPPADTFSGDFDANGDFSMSMSSLSTNKTYYVKIRGHSLTGGSGSASYYQYFSFKVPSITDDVIKQTQSADEPDKSGEASDVVSIALNKEVFISKSLLTISTEAKNANTLSCAVKNTGIDVAGAAPAYYAFGTTLFFDAKNSTSNQAGGMGFFVNGASDTGYFISIKTSESAASQGDEFKILKVKGGVIQKLNDNQSLKTNKNVGQQVGIISGTSYKIDVKVKVVSNKVTITCFINGFKVVASDTTAGKELILPRTANVSLFANLGTIHFDYVYAMPIKESVYNMQGMDTIYNQHISATAEIAYGDVFATGVPAVESNSTTKYVEEFGPIAREIRYVKKRYERTPSYPKFTFQNLNKGVNVLASKLSSFDAELYLLNASGVSTTVSSNSGTQISVVGNNLVKSDQIVYVDEDNDKFGVQEPITFESYWIQKISDAKNLSDFIKTQWSKNPRVVSLSVFGNPMISVSDIVSISYAYHGLEGTEKFIVTDVNHVWNEGLETTIKARSIYI
jgi:hypothetical protein